jgi:hypothetical protein
MKKILFLLVSVFFGLTGIAQNMQKAALVDLGGKSLVLYGFTDYKMTQDYLKARTTGVVLAVPYTKTKAPALTPEGLPDYDNGVYAMVSIVRSDNFYAETGYNNDPKHDYEHALKNQKGILKPEMMTQGNLTFYVTNPAIVNKIFMDGTLNYNPDALGMVLDHFYTSHSRFSEIGQTLWSNKSQMGQTEPISFRLEKKDDGTKFLEAKGFFNDSKGNLVFDLQMKESKNPVTELNRNWKANLIAGNDAETMLYPVNSMDQYYQRFFDATTDSYQVGGPIKTLLESIQFQPFLWQLTANRNAEIFFNYAPKK